MHAARNNNSFQRKDAEAQRRKNSQRIAFSSFVVPVRHGAWYELLMNERRIEEVLMGGLLIVDDREFGDADCRLRVWPTTVGLLLL